MKKTLVLLAAILYFNLAVKAQTTEQIVSNFKTLLAEATSDFKNVKGTVLENDSSNRTVYYKCAKTLGSSFEAICVNSNDNTSYFSAKFENGLSVTDELGKGYEVLKAVYGVLQPMLDSGKYKGGQRTQGKKTIVELKDLDGNYIVETELLPEPSGTETSHITITIYGKSWGKK